MTGRGPSAVDNHISDRVGNAKSLKQLLRLMLNLFTSGVHVPATNDKSIPIYFKVHGLEGVGQTGAGATGGSCLARGGAEGLLWWKISCTFWARSVIWSSNFSS